MTTAELRNAAQAAAERLEWANAADLMERAIAAYPTPPEKRGPGTLARLDLDRMQRDAAGWWAMAEQERAAS